MGSRTTRQQIGPLPILLNDENQIIISADKSVKLLPYRPRKPIPFTTMSDEEITAGAGGILIFDSECFKNYFLIAFKDTKTKKIILFIPPFNQFKLSWIMHNYTCVGFNSLKYDLPLLWLSYKTQDTKTLKEASNALINGMWYKELQKEFDFTIHPTAHIDLIEVAPLRGSLKLYGARLHAKRIQDVPWGGNNSLEDWQIPVTQDYCINDLDTTELLFDNLTEQLKLRTDLSREYRQDLMSKSDAQIAEAVIGSELMRLKGKYPSKPKIESEAIHKFNVPENMFFQTEYMQEILKTIAAADFGINENGRLESPKEIQNLKINIGNSIYRMGIGGLHSSEESRAVKANDCELVDVDVASYYPAIVIQNKLFPKHLSEDFLTVYKGLVDRRLEAKKLKNIAVSENLKVTINGTFGKTGSPFSILYAPEMTIQITVGGQLYLLMLIERLELVGIPVVSANTDGILIKCPINKKDEMQRIVKEWETTTGFITDETNYKAVFSRDVNAYLAIKENGEVKGKNILYDPWNGKSAKDRYWRFQKNPNAQICVEAIENLIVRYIPIEKTIRECTDMKKFVSVKNVKGGAHRNGEYLGKVVRWYMAKDEQGTINYILNGNKVPDTEGAVALMDLPDELPTNINFDWYIQRANEMLQDIGYYAKSKQIVFF